MTSSGPRVALAVAWLGLGLLAPDARARQHAGKGYRQLLNEVFQTELVYPQERGAVQLTVAPAFIHRDNESASHVPFMMEYGITNAWMIDLEWDLFVPRNSDLGDATGGIGDLGIGTMYSFMSLADSHFHATVGFEIGLRTGRGRNDSSEGSMEYEPFFVLARDFANQSQVFTQIGLSFAPQLHDGENDRTQEPAHELTWHAGFFIPGGPVIWTTELSWMNNEWNNRGAENHLYLTPGLVWTPGRWEFGIGVPLGVSGGSDFFSVIVMLTYEFDID